MKKHINYLTDPKFGIGAVAELLGCCRETVVRMIDKGLLVGKRLPGSTNRRVDRAELIHFLKERGEWEALTRLGIGAGTPEQTGFMTVGGDPFLFVVYQDGRPPDMIDLGSLSQFLKARNARINRDKRRRTQ